MEKGVSIMFLFDFTPQKIIVIIPIYILRTQCYQKHRRNGSTDGYSVLPFSFDRSDIQAPLKLLAGGLFVLVEGMGVDVQRRGGL